MSDNRTWRTNIGLRLTQETGAWLERQCEAENRTFANYVETLIMRDKAAHDPGRPVPHHGSGGVQIPPPSVIVDQRRINDLLAESADEVITLHRDGTTSRRVNKQ